MRRADRVTGLLLLAFAGYTIAGGWRLGYWQGRIPGPGFAPIWIGAGLALCALFLLLRRAAASEPPARPVERQGLVFAAGIAIVTAAATALMPRIGMMAGVILLLVALIRLLGGTWRSVAAAALVLPPAFYLIFVRWLGVPIPTGPWGF